MVRATRRTLPYARAERPSASTAGAEERARPRRRAPRRARGRAARGAPFVARGRPPRVAALALHRARRARRARARRAWARPPRRALERARRRPAGATDVHVDAVEQRPAEPRAVGAHALGRAGAASRTVAERSRTGRGSSRRRASGRAGNVALACAREMVTTPSSSGWRSASSAARRNSASSSRKSTPWCARLTSPGRGTVAAADEPRPRSPCGAARGRAARATTPRDAPSSPATLWIAVTSSASSEDSGGRSAGQPPREHRLARAGRTDHERLWPPAAAISSARRAAGLPAHVARGRPERAAGSSAASGPARGSSLSPAERVEELAERGRPCARRSPVDERRLALVAARDDGARDAARARAEELREHAADGCTAPVSDSSPRKRTSARAPRAARRRARASVAAAMATIEPAARLLARRRARG